MIWLISRLSDILGPIIVAFIFAVITGLIFAIAHFLFRGKKTKEMGVVAQQMALRIGAIYALVVALVFSALVVEVSHLLRMADTEAVSAGNIYWSLEKNQDSKAVELHKLIPDYLQSVIESDINPIEPNSFKRPAWKLIDRMRETIAQWEPSSATDELLRSYVLENIKTLSESREDRIVAQITPDLPSFFWAFLVLGYFLTLAPYLTIEHSKFGLFLIYGYAIINGLMFYGIIALDNPIILNLMTPVAFEELLNQIMVVH